MSDTDWGDAIVRRRPVLVHVGNVMDQRASGRLTVVPVSTDW